MEFKNLNQFKNLLKVGSKLGCIYHCAFAGRLATGQVLYKDQDLGVREVSIVQTNSFALRTPRISGEFVDSWCDFPKASMCKIEDNRLTIYEESRSAVSTDNQEATVKIPVLTYWFVED